MIEKEYLLNKDSIFFKQLFENGKLKNTYSRYFGITYKTTETYYNENLSTIRGEIIDSSERNTYGHFFEFYPNGTLRLYRYYVGNDNYSFSKEYSPEGELIRENGNIFVDYMPINDDSINLVFSSVFSDSIKVNLNFKGSPKEYIRLVDSKMQPMLMECRMPKIDDSLFLEINTIDRKTKENKIYYDTLVMYSN